MIDFVERVGGVELTGARILSNVKRLIETPDVAALLGVQLKDGVVYSAFPADEVVKSLRRVVNDLATGTVKVSDIYYKNQQVDYVRSFGPGDRPKKSTRLAQPAPLGDLKSRSRSRKTVPPTPPPKTKQDRTTVIGKASSFNPTPPRLSNIANELRNVNVEQFPNACAVLMRVLVELSVDHELAQMSLMTEQQRRSMALAGRMKKLADGMYEKGRISDQLRKMVRRIADGQGPLAASTPTFNQYVHNPHVFPRPAELRLAWDELEQFMVKLWP